jgi:hypothetical protein
MGKLDVDLAAGEYIALWTGGCTEERERNRKGEGD